MFAHSENLAYDSIAFANCADYSMNLSGIHRNQTRFSARKI